MCNAKGMNVKAGVIVELAFMTNEREAQDMMANKEFCLECAKELAEGFINYVTGGKPDQPVLKTSSEKEVMWLQMMLNAQISKKRIEAEYLTIDGQYGEQTANAVRVWQKYKRWTVGSGFFVGVNTLQSLNK